MDKWEALRRDFPVLERRLDGKRIVYFDNACYSLKPRKVIDQVDYYYEKLNACAGGRSPHDLAQETETLCEEARDKMAEFMGAEHSEDKTEVIWTRNTTEGMNLVAHALPFERGQNVVTTNLEHHSGILPFWKLQNQGVELRIVEADSAGRMDPAKFAEKIDRKTRLISIVWASNMTGTIAPLREIIKIAHDSGALVVADGAQYVPHHKVDVKSLDLDFLSFSVHKMCGPTGMGVFYGKYELLNEKMGPFMVGGETIKDVLYENGKITPIFDDPPRKFEPGLQNYSGIMGSGAAVEYLEAIGMDNIERRDEELRDYLSGRLSEIKELERIGPPVGDAYPRGALATFRLKVNGKYVSWADIATYMLEIIPDYKIMFRTGGHCVHPFHYSLGILPVPDPSRPNEPAGTTRVSLYFYNTETEIDTFVNSLQDFVKRKKHLTAV